MVGRYYAIAVSSIIARPKAITLNGKTSLTVAPERVDSGALAWIAVAPRATPVTGTLTLVAPAGKVTLGGHRGDAGVT
jgi:hypothetical protein